MAETLVVVGHGSIGARHARLAREAGLDVRVVSRRALDGGFATLADAFTAGVPKGVVIATETARHRADLDVLAQLGFDGPVLVEKPLVRDLAEADGVGGARVSVAYNLRFHPALQRLKQAIAGRQILSVTLFAGQDLTGWRPGRAVGDSYSASAAQGGGVLRDLSHEIDYAGWLFGPWRRLAALGGRRGPLPIDADDCWDIVAELESGAALTLHLDYYARPARREIAVVLADETIVVDLVAGRYRDRDGEHDVSVDRDATYRAQLDAFLSGDATLCGWNEGVEVMRFIDAAERAAATGQWVRR